MGTSKYYVVLLGNYLPDHQPSMLRYADSLAQALQARGHVVERVAPSVLLLGAFGNRRWQKWFGYVDKYLIFPFILKKKIQRIRKESLPVILHICDHSNAMYSFFAGSTPVVVTCHDVGAIKGARGLLPDCPATSLGRCLQDWICAGLRRATRIACVSRFTATELQELVLRGIGTKISVVPNGFNRSFQTPDPVQIKRTLSRLGLSGSASRFLLVVGSGLRRKNRVIVLQVFARVCRELDLFLVIAGEPLDDQSRDLVESLQITSRVVEVVRPDDQMLEVLYRSAYALLFPSRFEGFGWPIIEAQACGCPVLAADNSAQPEVMGAGGFLRNSEDIEGYVVDLLKLKDPEIRHTMIKAGLNNAGLFSIQKVAESMEQIYEEVKLRF